MSSAVKVLKKYWVEFPPQLRRFCVKALLLIVIWKLSYHLYLKPHRTIDKPLTAFTTASTVGFLSFFYEKEALSWKDARREKSASISLHGKHTLGIADGCNALELFLLYAGFIFCMPTNFKRMAIFITLGILGIYMLNILRCSGMFWFKLHKNEWFDFAHHYVFKIVVYVAIFGAWVWYCRKLTYDD